MWCPLLVDISGAEYSNVDQEEGSKAVWHQGEGALLVRPHEVEPWFHSWYRGRVETLDAKYNLIFR